MSGAFTSPQCASLSSFSLHLSKQFTRMANPAGSGAALCNLLFYFRIAEFHVTNHRLKAVALVTGCKPYSGQRPE